MVKQKYDVTGMTCSACSAHVEKAVRKLAGVADVQVNLLTNSMVITSEQPLDERAVVDAVIHAGYGACPAASGGAAAHASPEAAVPAAKPRANPAQAELANMKQRLWVSFLFLIPLMYVAMGSMVGLPLPGFLAGYENSVAFGMAQFLLALPVAYVNRKYYQVGFKTLFHGAPNMDSLIAIGSTAAFVYGVFAIVRMGYGLGVGDTALVMQYHHDMYFESAAMILALITLGKYLEARSKGKTSEAIEKLMDLAPKTATVERDGREQTIPVEQVQKDDVVLVRPGQSVPVDGVVLEGTSSLDEAAITGESIPVEKGPGDTVIAATINKAGFIKFRATKVGEDTTLAQIIRLVEDASASKAPIAKLADKIAGVFVPAVIAVAVLAAVVWLLLGQTAEFAVSTAIAVLVISCPCALGLATPVAIMVGTGKGAENGILIKSGEALQTAHNVNAVVLDKTGTITEGKPVVTDVLPFAQTDAAALVRMALALETPSEHPLAQAVVAYGKACGMEAAPVQDFSAVFGRGVAARLDGAAVSAGNAAMMAEYGPLPAEVQAELERLSGEGKTPLLFAREGHVVGIIAVADTVKPTSAAAIAELQHMGVEVTMLTGDNRRTAAAIQRQTGIRNVVAEVLPQEKEQHVARLKQQGRVVAMVGDGINDAPALARADVGIAIGAGTDVAIESADIVLMKSDLRDVVTAIQLSKAVIRNIKENLFWAFFYNTLGIPLAAGVFFIPFAIKLNPMIGAAAMSLSSVFVVSNALRLKRFKPHFTARSGQPPAVSVQPARPLISAPATAQTARNQPKEKENETMKTVTLHVEGMMCQHCVQHVKNALEKLPGVHADVNLEDKTAACTLEQDTAMDALKAAVADAGYEVSGVDAV